MKKNLFFIVACLIAFAANSQKLDIMWSHDMSSYGAAIRNIALVSGTEVAATNISFSGGTDNVVFFDANGQQTEKVHDVAKFLNDNQIGTTGEDGVFSPYTLGRGIAVDAVGNIVVNLGFPTTGKEFVVIAPDGTMKHIHCEVPAPNESARADFFGAVGDINSNGYLVMAMNQKNYVAIYNIYDGEQDIDYSYVVYADEAVANFTNETKVAFPVKIVAEDAESVPEFFVYHRSVSGVRYSDGASSLTVLEGENFTNGKATCTGIAAFQVNGANYIVMPTVDESGARANAFKIVNVATGNVVVTCQGITEGGVNYAQDYSAWVNEDGTVSIAQLVQGRYLAMYKFDPRGVVADPILAETLTIDSQLTIEEGSKAVITATLSPENVSTQTLTWTSSNTQVVTVSNGIVTALSVGTAIITATTTDGTNLSDSCTVTVTEPTVETPTTVYGTITKEWECDAHKVYGTDNVRSATGFGNKMYIPNVTTGFVEIWENGFKTDSIDVNSFLIAQGEKYEATNSSGEIESKDYSLWSAIACDDADNLLVNAGGFGDVAKGKKWVYIPASDRSAMQVVNLEYPAGATEGRVDYVGRIVGDLSSETGGALITTPHQATVAPIFNLFIENGKLVSYTEDSWVIPSSTAYNTFSIFGTYATIDDITNATSVNELGKTLYCRWRSNTSIYGWDGIQMSPISVGTDGCAGNGFDVFQIEGIKFYVVPFKNGVTTSGRSSSFEIRNLSTGDVVAQYNTQGAKDSYMSSFVARVNADGKSATIYAYSQYDKIGVYTFTPGDPVLAEALTIDSQLTIEGGNEAVITATLSPENVSNKTLTWTSSNTQVATVSNGTVTAVSTGTAIIIATTTDGTNLSDTCTVTVTEKAPIEPQNGAIVKMWCHDMSTYGYAIRNAVCVGDKIIVNDMTFSGGSGKVLFFDATGKITKEYDVNSWLAEQQIGTTNEEDGVFTPYTLGSGIAVDAVGNIVVNLGFPNAISATDFAVIAPDGTMKHIHCEVPMPGEANRADFFDVAGDILSNGYIALTPNNKNYVVVYNIYDGMCDIDYSYLVYADEVVASFSNETKVAFPVKTVDDVAEYAPEFFVYHRSVAGLRYSNGVATDSMIVMDGENFLQGKATCTGIAAFQVNGVNYIVMPTLDESGARANAFKIVNATTGEVVVTCQGITDYATNYRQDYSAWVNEDGTVSIAQLVSGKYLAMYKFDPSGVVSDPVLAEALTIDSQLTIEDGSEAVITATLSPENVSNKTLTWTSSNTQVATVSNGTVTAVSAGTAIIIATTTDGTNLSDTCTVTVTEKAPVLPDNYFKIDESITIKRGTTFALPVEMVNKATISAFQCDIYLPEGVTVATKDGVYDVELSARASSTHSISVAKQEDGAIRIISYSTQSEAFTGNSGELFNVNINVSSDYSGENKLNIKNIVLSTTDGDGYTIADISQQICVFDKYDNDGDGLINLVDVVNLANYILGNKPEDFNFDAADITSDGILNVVDIVNLVNYILKETENTTTQSTTLRSLNNSRRVLSTSEAVNEDNTLYIEDFSIKAGETQQIAIKMKNLIAFTGVEFELCLPEGLSVYQDNGIPSMNLTDRKTSSHTLATASQNEGIVKVLSYSTTSMNFRDNSGDLIYLTLVADDSFTGTREIVIRNIVLATNGSENESGNAMGYMPSDTKASVSLKEISMIDAVEIESNNNVEYYNLNGVKVDSDNLQQGMYIKRQGGKATKVVIN